MSSRMKTAITRITRRDMKSSAELSELGIHVLFDESDIMKATAIIIGPKDTPYENGILYFSIQFPVDYPFSPPQIYYLSTSKLRIHPNLYVGKSHNDFRGKVCLSIINTWSGPKWTTAMDLGSILISLQSLMCNKAITHEPGYEKSSVATIEMYNDIVQYDTFRHLILRNRIPFNQSFSGFTEIIQKHLSESKDEVLKKIDLACQKYPIPKVISLKIYNISVSINYPELRSKIISEL